jgi:DNA-binding GntR family transcriptional regulator
VGEPPRPADIRRYIAVDREFHTELCALAQNHSIDKSYRETSLHLNMRHIYNLSVPPDIRRTYREHAELVDALSRHSRQAVSIIKGHLVRSRRHVLQGSFSS